MQTFTDDNNDHKEDEKENNENENDDKNDTSNDSKTLASKKQKQQKALLAKTLELQSEKDKLPWLETFDVIPTQALPFSKNIENGNPLDIHDDLKREVAFYNVALEAVQRAKRSCYESDLKFTRPNDFFAEMVKSDEHMAKIKDRLIFESKKIEAFGQRKANKEQKLRLKEARSKRLEEKAKYKKDNLKAVENWAKSAAMNRLEDGRVRDGIDANDDGNGYLNSQKRKNMNKKYGFGGKKGRFKQMDQKMINDMSDYNPYGNFGGVGKKKRAGGGGNNKRAGKRARDAMKQRR